MRTTHTALRSTVHLREIAASGVRSNQLGGVHFVL